MLTGHAAFQGPTFSDTIVSVLERNPDWSTLPSATPESIKRLLAHCLEKNNKDRLRDIGDARIELREALRQPEPTPMWRYRGRKMPWRGIGAGAALVGALIL